MSEEKRALQGGLDASEQSDKRPVEKELSGIERYDDIVDLPRPKMKHARMSAEARAAQFAPFAALVGYESMVAETSEQVIEAVENETEIVSFPDGVDEIYPD